MYPIVFLSLGFSVLSAPPGNLADITEAQQAQLNYVSGELRAAGERIRVAEEAAASVQKTIKATQENMLATQENVRATQERLTKLNVEATALAASLEKVNERADSIIALISPETAETVLQNVSMKREILARQKFEGAVQKTIDDADAVIQKRIEEAEKRVGTTESAVESVRANVITMLFAVIASLVVGLGSIIGFGITILKVVAQKQFVVRERPSEPEPKRLVTDITSPS